MRVNTSVCQNIEKRQTKMSAEKKTIEEKQTILLESMQCLFNKINQPIKI